MRHLGSAAPEKHFLWPLRNAAFLWCRLSVTLRWSGLDKGRANSVSVQSQRSDRACHSGCGDASLGWETAGGKQNCYWIITCIKSIWTAFFFFGYSNGNKRKMSHATAGRVAQNALRAIRGRWTLDILPQKETTAQLFETQSNYWWVVREKKCDFQCRTTRKTGERQKMEMLKCLRNHIISK